MTNRIERPILNSAQVTPRLNLPGDLPTVPSEELPHVQQEPDMAINMLQVAESSRQQTRFLAAQERALDESGQGLPRKMRGIVDDFVGIVVNNETTVFHNGDEKKSFTDRENALSMYLQTRWFMDEKCAEYFEPNGNLRRDEIDEAGNIRTDKKTETGWNNIAAIAPKIAEILLSKEHNIKAVNRDQLKNIFSFAIDVAEDPSILERTQISVGFGGSADSETSSRLPVYTLPAHLIATEINTFYQERLDTMIDRTRVKKFETEQIAKQKKLYGDTLSPTVIDHIRRTAQAYLYAEKGLEESTGSEKLLLPSLNEKELQEVKKLYAIPDKPLSLRFFSGAEAGIKSNFPTEEEAVRTRREENWRVIRDFTNEHFPQIESQIEYQNDIPWDNHSVEQQTVLEYYAHLLRTSDKHSIKETLTFLEGLGVIKGGENGRELAAEYAGLHVSFFGDKVNLPAAYTNFFDVEHVFNKPKVSIMLGGKSEEMFCGIRDYIAEHANPTDLRDFALLKATRLELEEAQRTQRRVDTAHLNGSAIESTYQTLETSKLRHMAKRLDQWTDAIKNRRATYEKPNARIAPSDRVQSTISLIEDVDSAPYYMGAGDEAYGADPTEQIIRINATDFTLTPEESEGMTEEEAEKEKIRREIHAEGVIRNLQFMQKSITKAA